MHCAADRIEKALRIKEKQVREETIKTISEELMAKYFPEGETAPKYKNNDVKAPSKKCNPISCAK